MDRRPAVRRVEARARRRRRAGEDQRSRSKDDQVSTPSDLHAVEPKYVTCIDYDKAGFTKVDPGLIGLHAFGTRPADQGSDKMGQDMADTLPLLTQLGGFGAIFAHRSGIPDVVARVMTSGNPELRWTRRTRRARSACSRCRTSAA